MEIQFAPDVKKRIVHIVKTMPDFHYIDSSRIVCMRSTKATSRARARIWSFPHIWQMALALPSYYVIEVLSQYFDKMSAEDQTRVLIHELMHIPKNFSGALVPHRGIHKKINVRSVEELYRVYMKVSS
jgi:predicted metallopeptidase